MLRLSTRTCFASTSRFFHLNLNLNPKLNRTMTTAATVDASQFLADKDAPIANLSAKKYFNELTEKEKLYAHYFSKAGHWGSRAVLRSVSPESEGIFDLIMKIHKAVDAKYDSIKADSTIVKNYLDYSSQILSNLGNYKSFGDSKFIPRLSQEEFQTMVDSLNNEEISNLFDSVKSAIYSLDDKISMLGSPENGHVSGYYLNVVSKCEGEAVDAALAQNGIMPENIRVSKVDNQNFVVHVASAFISNTTGYYPSKIDFEIKETDGTAKNASLTFKFGDHSKEFSKVVENLIKAKEYAANETQVKMIENYISSFMTGSMKSHYQSQIEWVKDIKPTVETNVGFIETYRDYLGTKGEWECLVAMVNKERTEKFGELVNNAKEFISELPWTTDYEKDVFTPPDFTSLEVLTFSGSGVPAGINIPNYDKIRINIGFKNVSLGNVLNARSGNEPVSFISEEEQDLYNKYRVEAFEVQVGIHELLGHGTGKLLMELDDGTFNFDKSSPPLDLNGKPITTYYGKGETWGSKFGSIAGSYEECRAESVAMFLGTNRKLLEIFGYKTKEEQDNIIYIMYMSMCRAGLLAMEFYDPKHAKWGQAHCQARYAILKNYLDAGNGLVKLEYTDKENFDDLKIIIDKSKIATIGQESIGEFLKKLHIFKCSGNVEEGTKFYVEQTTISDELLQFRDVVLKKKLPRKQLIQANTFVNGETVDCVEYDESPVGMIQSFAEREC